MSRTFYTHGTESLQPNPLNSTLHPTTNLETEQGMEPELTFGGTLGPFCTGLYLPWDPKPLF